MTRRRTAVLATTPLTLNVTLLVGASTALAQ